MLLCVTFMLLLQVSVSAASQLSQAELEELLAENAKLKQLLNSYAHKLKPEQVGKMAVLQYAV